MEFNKPSIEHFRRMNDLFLHRYERYLPTAFDESDSLLEKVNKVIHYLNNVTEHMNDQSQRLEQWQEKVLDNLDITLEEYVDVLEQLKNEYETFREEILNDILPGSVENKLDQWLEDGTIMDIINNTIFNNISTRLNTLEDRLLSIRFSVKDFGAVGDGVADDTNAFRQAAQLGQVVSVPEGVYIVSQQVSLVANTQFIGEGDNSVIKFKDGNSRHTLFRATGSFGEQVPITQNSELGDNFVTVGSPQNFNTGEFIRVMSQRTAMGLVDATYDTTLGSKTADAHRVYFGEYQQLSAINTNSGQLFFRAGLIFRDYLTHNNNENDSDARQNATVQKVHFAENIKISNLKVDGPYSTVALFDTCHNARIENVSWVNAEDGDFVNFRECYNSEAFRCQVYYRADVPFSAYYARNGYKIQSSQYCGFDSCYMKHGSQSVDITYNGHRPTIPAIYCYIKNCTIIGSIQDGITTHGGTFAPIITNNIISKCFENGITVRSPESIIRNNVVSGTPREKAPLTYGIQVFQYAVRDCMISDNDISHFLNGVATRESNVNGFGQLNLVIRNNTFTRCNTGVWLRRNTSATKLNIRANISIVGNRFSRPTHEYGKGVQLGSHWRGVSIKDNTFISLPSNSPYNPGLNGGIYTGSNCFDLEVRGNLFVGRIIWNPIDIGSITDFDTYPSGPYNFVFDDTNIWSGREQDIRTRGDNPPRKVDRITIGSTTL